MSGRLPQFYSSAGSTPVVKMLAIISAVADLAAVIGANGTLPPIKHYYLASRCIYGSCIVLRYVGCPVAPYRDERQKTMCRSKAEGGRRCRGGKGLGSSVAVDSTGISVPSGPSGRMRRTRAAVLQAAEAA